MRNVVDTMSAADILEGLPNRIHEVIVRHVAERPDHPAFVEDATAWSYRQFADAVDAVTTDFVRLGVRAGDRVLVASENAVALAAFVFACSRLNVWSIVANPRLSPRELDQIYVHSGARRVLLTGDVSKEAADHATRLQAERRYVGPFAGVAVGALNETTAPEPVEGDASIGYYRAPELTAKAIDRGGWFNAGDLARLDDDHLFIVGRTQELIIRSGFNVYPAEVEAVLDSHEMVVRSAAIGRAVPGNEEIVAFVKILPGAAITGKELMEYAGRRLASYKRPCEIVLLESLPAASTGKVLKHRLWEAARVAKSATDAPPATRA